MKAILIIVIVIVTSITISCKSNDQIPNKNISKKAPYFEINIVFKGYMINKNFVKSKDLKQSLPKDLTTKIIIDQWATAIKVSEKDLIKELRSYGYHNVHKLTDLYRP